MTPSRPYLMRALHEWILENDCTPYVLVDAGLPGVQVPEDYIQNGQIVLNVSASAVGSIAMGDLSIELSARFGGKLEHISVPYGAVAAIYAKENGAGTSLAIENIEPEAMVEKPEPSSMVSTLKSVDNKADAKVSVKSQSTQTSKVKKPSLSVVKK